MTQYEREYELGRQAFLEHLPFKSTRSIAWQNGWLDSFNADNDLNELMLLNKKTLHTMKFLNDCNY